MVDALLEPFLDPASRTYWVGLLTAALVAVGLTAYRTGWRSLPALLAPLRTRSSALDLQLLLARQLLGLLGLFPALTGSFALAVALVTQLDRWYVPDLTVGSPTLLAIAYTLTLFVVWDASRWVAHWLMHRVPVLWAFHQVHHSAEALTPLTFHRLHPIESLIYQLRGIAVTGTLAGLFYWLFRGEAQPVTLFGVHALGWLANVVSGNLRHSQVWWSFGRLERWLISPAQHQLHHALDQDHVNYGTWLSLWDRLAGTLALAERTPDRYGLRAPNHEHDLLSAWFGPFRDLGSRLRPASRPAAAPAPARRQR